MTLFNDATIIDLTCDQCAHQFKASIGEIKAHVQFACPNCGDLSDTQQFLAKLAFMEKQAGDFSSFIGELNKKRL